MEAVANLAFQQNLIGEGGCELINFNFAEATANEPNHLAKD